MEETLGKRISAHRKRLGLTQDALAEKLGVTAQAVSKWENDQSCPDITMLPKLAEVFDITTDSLLGLPIKEVHQGEIVQDAGTDEDEPEGVHISDGSLDFQWEAGRKGHIAFAAWLLAVGALLFASNLWDWDADFFDLLWSSGLVVFGLSGLFPKFSVFRLGCVLFGGYFLYIEITPLTIQKEYILPIFLLLFGLSLLIDGFRKPKTREFHISRSGKNIGGSDKNFCSCSGERFDCATCFGENDHLIHLNRLSGGKGEVSFGELTLDLSGCGEIADGCTIDLDCAFGSLEILVPRKYRAEAATNTTFGTVETKGIPDLDARAAVLLNCDVSFGQITIRYI